jgi:hypothetical protein
MLTTQAVQRGDWIIVKGLADQGDLSPKYITVSGNKLPAYIDGSDYRVRCPKDIEPGQYTVYLGEASLGTIMVY